MDGILFLDNSAITLYTEYLPEHFYLVLLMSLTSLTSFNTKIILSNEYKLIKYQNNNIK